MPIISGGGFNGGTAQAASSPWLTVRGVNNYGDIVVGSDVTTDAVALSALGLQISGGVVEVLDATNTAVRGGFTQDGAYIAVHAAPDSADLGAGDLFLWFDQTDGAAKLMVKAKSANGTVATGSVNLA